MEYLILWVFGFPICLMAMYYAGEVDETSTKEEIVSEWLLSAIWPISVSILLVLKLLYLTHDALLKLGPEGE